MKRKLFITRDELLAAGALDVPPDWRKWLGGRPEKELSLFGEEDMVSSHPSAELEDLDETDDAEEDD